MINKDCTYREVFENIVENTYNNLVLTDSEGKILYASPVFRNEFGFSLDKEVSFEIFDMVYPEDVNMMKGGFSKAVSGNEKISLVFRLMLNSDGFTHFEAIFSNLLNVDSMNVMLISFRNVSAYKNSLAELEQYKNHLEELVDKRTNELIKSLDKEKEVIEQQKQFITMVSHEFRTPLTIIDGNAQIIVNRGDKLTQEMLQKRSITIRNAVDRLVGLIERVLSDRVMESGDLNLDLSLCNYAAMVRNICIERLGITPQAKIQLDIDRSIPEIMLDEKLVHQVVVNLLSNAFKYSREDPEIKVKMYLNSNDVVLEISDKGVGIPSDEMDKMFKKYFRASTAAETAGTGLGLNLVKQIVDLHDGNVSIESDVGIGTTVTVSLPIRILNN